MKLLTSLFAIFALTIFSGMAYGQKVALKTNLLYGGVTYTPNLALEYGISKRMTLNLSGGYNPWNINNTVDKGEKLVHWLVQPEFRYWSCERFNGHFFGFHGTYSLYNIGGKEFPILLGTDSGQYRHEGSAYGGGLTYGYVLNLSMRFALEFEIGAGYMHLDYDKYYAYKCGKFIGHSSRDYFGLTKAGITLAWNIF